jgi:hypothetical protein
MGGIRGLVSGVIETGGSGTAISCPISGLPLIKLPNKWDTRMSFFMHMKLEILR